MQPRAELNRARGGAPAQERRGRLPTQPGTQAHRRRATLHATREKESRVGPLSQLSPVAHPQRPPRRRRQQLVQLGHVRPGGQGHAGGGWGRGRGRGGGRHWTGAWVSVSSWCLGGACGGARGSALLKGERAGARPAWPRPQHSSFRSPRAPPLSPFSRPPSPLPRSPYVRPTPLPHGPPRPDGQGPGACAPGLSHEEDTRRAQSEKKKKKQRASPPIAHPSIRPPLSSILSSRCPRSPSCSRRSSSTPRRAPPPCPTWNAAWPTWAAPSAPPWRKPWPGASGAAAGTSASWTP